MLNRRTILCILASFLPLLLILATRLSVAVFVFYPAILFSYFFPWQERPRWLERLIISLSVLTLSSCLVIRFSWELLLLGTLQGVLAFAIYIYRRQWKLQLDESSQQKEMVQRDLETFSKKFDSRLTSLHHLEKQVTGLLDLFEVSKEFSEFLNFDGITEILAKRVRPLFPFKTAYLLLSYVKPDAVDKLIRYKIDEQGVQTITDPLHLHEQEAIEQFKKAKSAIHQDNRWIFPLLFDDVLNSSLIIEGAHPDDLAKYEVLSAFLTLQVSKIRLYHSVRELAIRDSLTRVFVRRHFLERFEEEMRRSIKFSLPLAVLMLDIDHFKRYNDEYGHIAGDATLQQVADLLQQSLRKVDIVGRYGGEEFIVVIPEARAEGAMEIADRIRSNIARHVFKIYNTEARVTVSIGLALFTPEKFDPSSNVDVSQLQMSLSQKADQALYQAKEEGRNQVVLHPSDRT